MSAGWTLSPAVGGFVAAATTATALLSAWDELDAAEDEEYAGAAAGGASDVVVADMFAMVQLEKCGERGGGDNGETSVVLRVRITAARQWTKMFGKRRRRR